MAGQRIQDGMIGGQTTTVAAAGQTNRLIDLKFMAPVTCRVHMRSTLVPWTSIIQHGSGLGGVSKTENWAVNDVDIDLAGDQIEVVIVAPVGSTVQATCAPSYWPPRLAQVARVNL